MVVILKQQWYETHTEFLPEKELMEELVRFGVSIEKSLLDWFDTWLNTRSWTNRSEAIRDIIREKLVEESWQKGEDLVVASLTFVYDHHVTDLQTKLTKLQHDHDNLVLSAMHVHLDHNNCIEVLILKGAPKKIQAIANSILGVRGVKHGKLVHSVPNRKTPTKRID